jgi:hypothetical protein
VSNWEKRPLTSDQIQYASLDAHTLLAIFDILAIKMNNVSSLYTTGTYIMYCENVLGKVQSGMEVQDVQLNTRSYSGSDKNSDDVTQIWKKYIISTNANEDTNPNNNATTSNKSTPSRSKHS